MMAVGMLGFALFVAFTLLSIVFFTALSSRLSEKRKNDEDMKPKRAERSRIALGDDGELVDLSEEDTDHAQRSRNP